MRNYGLALLAMVSIASGVSHSQTVRDWTEGVGGPTAAFGNTGNWFDGVRPGSLTSNTDIASFGTGTSGNIGLNFGTGSNGLGGSPYYLGTLRLAASNSTARTFGNNASTNGVLTLAQTGSTPIIDNLSSVLMTINNNVGGGSGTFSISITNANSGINAVGNITINTSLTGAGGINKTGSGTLTLATGNTYSGKTTISAGTVAGSGESMFGANPASFTADQITLNGGTFQATGNVNFSSNRGITLGASGGTFNTGTFTTTLTNVVTGSGSLTTTGTGTVILAGNHTYTGTTTISGGTLQVGNGGTSGTLGTGAVTNNAQLTFNRGDSVTVANNISGSGNVTKLVSGVTLTLTGNNTYTGTTTISAGTLRIGDGGSTGSIGTGNVDIASGATLLYDRTNTYTIPGIISGAGSVSTNPSASGGTLILTGVNTYIGTTFISSSKTLQIGNGSSTSSITSNVNMSGTATLIFNSANDWTYSGTLSGFGSLQFIKQAANTVTLSADNSGYNGTVSITGGTLSVSSDNSLGMVVPFIPTDLLFMNGGTLQTTATMSIPAERGIKVGTSTGAFNVNTGTTLTINSVISDLSGAGILAKQGGGTLTLTNSNTYTGATNVTAGTLQLGNGGASGTIAGGSTVNVSSGATFAFNRSDTFTFGNTIAGAGIVDQRGTSGSITILTNNNPSLTGTVNVTSGTLRIGNTSAVGGVGTATVNVSSGATFNIARNDTTFTFSNVINGAGTVSYGIGNTLILTGNNGITGQFSITNGILQVGNGGSSGTLGTATVSLSSGTTLRTNRSDAALNISGVISGAGGNVVQQGTGTATLSGNNSYTGTTTVSAGTLLINGNQSAASGAVAINGGALGGTGTVGGTISVNSGGTLQGGSGSASGTLNTTTINVNAGGAIRPYIAASGTNSSIAMGSTTLNFASSGSIVRPVALTGFTNTSPGAWNIVTGISTLNVGSTPQPDGTVLGNIFFGSSPTGDVTIDLSSIGTTLNTGDIFWLTYSSGNVVLHFAPVPEPTTLFGLGALGLGGLAWLRRRKRA